MRFMIALGLGLLYPALASAQAQTGSVELGAGFGRFVGGSFAAGSTDAFDQKLVAAHASLSGVWAGSQLTRDWGAEIAIRRTTTNLLQPAGGASVKQTPVAGFIFATIETSAIRSFRLGNCLPYVGLGAGLANLNPEVPDPAVHDSNRFCVSTMAGARYYFARWVGVRVEFRGRATYLGKGRFGTDKGFVDGARWFTNADVLGGAFLSFGGN
jgi:hypothetical protein